jgi:RNA polymerase sigma-70 factor (ECF subfamily)
MNDLDAASMRGLCDEHGAALCRHAVRLTGDRPRAEDVRNMIIDERRSLRFRHEACELDGSGTPDHAGVAVANPRCAGEALAATPRRDSALVFPEWTTAQIADDRRIPERTVKSRLHYALRARRLTLQEIGVRHDAEVVTAPRLDTGRGFRQAAIRMRK